MNKSIIVFLLLLLAAYSGHAQYISSIPFTVTNHCIYFYCRVNETDSLKFLLDTGADGSVINEASLHKLALKIDGQTENVGSNGSNMVKSSSGNTMHLGGLQKANVFFTVIPFGTDDFDGIIGTDLMKDHIVEIDYGKMVVNFYPANDHSLHLDGYTQNRLYVQKHYPTVIRASFVVKGKKYKGYFGIDTGADDVLTVAAPYQRKHKQLGKMPKMGTAQATGSNNVPYQMDILLCPEILFGKRHFYRIPVTISNATEGVDASPYIAGFFGNLFLQKHNMVIDYPNRRLYLKLNHNLYKDYYE